VAIGVGVPALAHADDPAWRLRVGHSYSSVNALAQPATFVWSADLDRPTLTKLDMGLLIDGPWAMEGGFSFGMRASAGSAREKPQRIFSSLLRGWRLFDPIVVAGNGEYEADGGFDVRKGVLGIETTPLGGLRDGSVGAPAFRMRWRPWVGLGYGNVFTTDEAAMHQPVASARHGARRGAYVPGRAPHGDGVGERDEAGSMSKRPAGCSSTAGAARVSRRFRSAAVCRSRRAPGRTSRRAS
jgi:hypothetical protein